MSPIIVSHVIKVSSVDLVGFKMVNDNFVGRRLHYIEMRLTDNMGRG